MIKSIVILGGGAAGWITAGILAARYRCGDEGAPIRVTLVESASIGIIGVGEGTWPTMANTLKALGIPEVDFIRSCDASFKQGSVFRGWVTGAAGDEYCHPFSLPQGFDQVNLPSRWRQTCGNMPFADAVGIQAALCTGKRAPKPLGAAEYASIENHGYHLDAGKFAALLARHCTETLGVRHILADIAGVESHANGDIAALATKCGQRIEGDLFIDCSGQAAILIGRHFGVPFISRRDVLFIDRAVATQVPYPHPQAEIESATLSTAQRAGWIWDIGLPTRRGVGYVYSSAHGTVDEAKAALRAYLAPGVPDPDALHFRELSFEPGHRETFWVKNCVAVGMSAGFLEPLEASALVMVELAATMISEHLPASRAAMDTVARNFNRAFRFRWDRIVDFLKLHYVLSKREDSAFWRDNRRDDSIPESLKDLLALWQHQPPANNGFLSPYDPFPAASYQYVLYGMGFETAPCHLEQIPEIEALADHHLQEAARRHRIVSKLPGNRELITAICAQGAEHELDLARSISRSCIEVPFSAAKELAKTVPLFFRPCPATGTPTCVALAGLAYHERLIDLPIGLPPAAANDAALLGLLPSLQLSEPVALDITFNDTSRLRLTGLSTVNPARLRAARAPGAAAPEMARLMPLLQAMQESLVHVPKLIDARNRKLETTPISSASG